MSVNQESLAFKSWPILIERASKKENITYKELAEQIGVHYRVVRHSLGEIQKYCQQENLPPLTILVVNQSTKKPSHGFTAITIKTDDDLTRGRDRVYEYPWKKRENPFSYASDGSKLEDLAKKLVRFPLDRDSLMKQVTDRSSRQELFRKALLITYKNQCAFCGLTLKEALEACHIVPWSEASDEERFSLDNGILLCSIHHRLFDAGQFTIRQSGEIIYRNPERRMGSKSGIDEIMTSKLHGKIAFCPAKKEYQPSEKLIDYHQKKHNWDELS